MSDLDNDNLTPDFDDLIAQARQLREEGRDDEAIAKYEEAMKIDRARPELCKLMELYIKRGEPSHAVNCAIRISSSVWHTNQPEAGETYKTIFDILNTIPDDEIVDSPGLAYAVLAMFTEDLGETDLYHLSQNSKARANAYGWTDFHKKCYQVYLSASEENYEETLATLREWANENPAAWFYVGRFELEKVRVEEAREAFGQVPENDPNYVRAMLLAGECWECDDVFYEAEEYYQKALDAAPRSREARLAYLYNHFKILLEEAAENGFDRDRVDQASKFIGKIYRVLSGEPAEVEQDREVERRRGNASAGPRLLAEQDTIFNAQIIQLLNDQIVNEVRIEGQRTREEIRAGREDIQNLREQLEANTAASMEMIRKHVIEQLQLSDEQLADCELELGRDHSEFWGNLNSASVRYLATGCYILDVLGRNARRIEYSCAAIEFAKALETELRQYFVEPFISFAEQRGIPDILGRAHDEVTLGNIYRALEQPGLRTEFVNSLGESGQFLLTDFHVLGKIKTLRDAAAHGGDIGRRQATELRNMVLKILPKIVALRSR